MLFFAGVAQRLVRLPSKQRMTVRFCSPALCKVVKSLLLRFCRFDSDHILNFRICGEMVYTKVCRTFNFNTNFNCSLYIYFFKDIGQVWWYCDGLKIHLTLFDSRNVHNTIGQWNFITERRSYGVYICIIYNWQLSRIIEW